MAEHMTRGEAIQYLTMYRDLAADAQTKDQILDILAQVGNKIGYAPAFRCLVKGLSPEDSIRWGK